MIVYQKSKLKIAIKKWAADTCCGLISSWQVSAGITNMWQVAKNLPMVMQSVA
jgi:hypothetical protein